jgi:formate transporter
MRRAGATLRPASLSLPAMPEPLFGSDAFSPAQISEKVEQIGVTKARLPLLQMAMLGVLAGGFIGLGGLFYVIVAADPELGFAAQRILGGAVFSLGLLLVVIAGAELFTGNNLLVMAWAEGKLRTTEVLRNWAVVLAANLVGALGLAVLVIASGHPAIRDGLIADAYIRIAHTKADLPFLTAFASGILCNALVCLAVWMALAGRSVVDKAIAILFPITAFVAAGFEHSVANLYFFAMGMLLEATGWGPASGVMLTLGDATKNLVPVVLGNIVGGSVMVAAVYHVIYRRNRSATA